MMLLSMFYYQALRNIFITYQTNFKENKSVRRLLVGIVWPGCEKKL